MKTHRLIAIILASALILAGALKENPLTARLLSYEVNVYFGILCAEFTP